MSGWLMNKKDLSLMNTVLVQGINNYIVISNIVYPLCVDSEFS